MIDEPTRGGDTGVESESASGGDFAPSRELLELDHVYEALGHPRRRYLCYTLLEDEEWTLDELATKIAAWEGDVSEHAVADRQRQQAYVSLYHAHVPKLADDGIISFDPATETIRAAENADQVLATLEGLKASLDDGQDAHARGQGDDTSR